MPMLFDVVSHRYREAKLFKLACVETLITQLNVLVIYCWRINLFTLFYGRRDVILYVLPTHREYTCVHYFYLFNVFDSPKSYLIIMMSKMSTLLNLKFTVPKLWAQMITHCSDFDNDKSIELCVHPKIKCKTLDMRIGTKMIISNF